MLVNSSQSSGQDQYRDRLKAYLEAVLQCDFSLRDWAGSDALPVFLSRSYWFFETRLGRTPILFMSARESSGHTPAEIKKHLELTAWEFDGVVAYSNERLAANFRARLIAAGIAFAIPGNQLYLPELAVDLREHFKGLRAKRPDKLSPSAQQVLFCHLLDVEYARPITPSELANPLRYSIMTTSRAFDELAAAGLARIERNGRKKLLWFRFEGRPLVEQAKPILLNPQRRLHHIRWLKEPPDLPLAGEHALARLSNLNPANAPPAYAVTSEQARDFFAANWAKLAEADYDSDGALATWRYDPGVLAKNQMVDPLSLFAQYWNDPDERLSMAAEELLELLP